MKCLVCNGSILAQILYKKPIKIWIRASDDEVPKKPTFVCSLLQCQRCGHIQQEVTSELEEVMNQVYSSSHAQASTPVGVGDWGKRRAQMIIEKFELNGFKSALEIGSHKGYLLEYLKNQGFSNLVGIEPSLEKSFIKDGIEYIKDFVSKNTYLGRKFDLIYAIAAFEHIKDINGIITFCKNHLNEYGELFFQVPNCRNSFISGDPDVFMHEHIHYYTRSSLYTLLWVNGLFIRKIEEEHGAFFVYARNQANGIKKPEMKKFICYKNKLDDSLAEISKVTKEGSFAFHGLNNALNNILGWLDIKDEFSIFENDKEKIGKTYFGKVIQKPDKNNIQQFDRIFIVPSVFFDEIKKQYEDLGYEGEICRVAKNDKFDSNCNR